MNAEIRKPPFLLKPPNYNTTMASWSDERYFSADVGVKKLLLKFCIKLIVTTRNTIKEAFISTIHALGSRNTDLTTISCFRIAGSVTSKRSLNIA